MDGKEGRRRGEWEECDERWTGEEELKSIRKARNEGYEELGKKGFREEWRKEAEELRKGEKRCREGGRRKRKKKGEREREMGIEGCY